MPRPVKGSPEAKEWGARMAEARKTKSIDKVVDIVGKVDSNVSVKFNPNKNVKTTRTRRTVRSVVPKNTVSKSAGYDAIAHQLPLIRGTKEAKEHMKVVRGIQCSKVT